MGRYRIMIVDDEQEVRQAMIRKLDWEAFGLPGGTGSGKRTGRLGEGGVCARN